MTTLSKSSKRQLEKIRQSLREWDPIGIRPGPGNDEYDSYASGVLKLLKARRDASRLEAHLGQLRKVSMGLQPDPRSDRETAQRICDWWARQ